jgi:hypothetical protein
VKALWNNRSIAAQAGHVLRAALLALAMSLRAGTDFISEKKDEPWNSTTRRYSRPLARTLRAKACCARRIALPRRWSS